MLIAEISGRNQYSSSRLDKPNNTQSSPKLAKPEVSESLQTRPSISIKKSFVFHNPVVQNMSRQSKRASPMAEFQRSFKNTA